MELGEAHAVRVLDDEGVDVGDVDAGLDDGGAHQHVRLPVHHGLHDGGELLLPHAAVAHRHPCLLPQHLLDAGGGEIDALHPVVEVVDLAAPAQLPAHGVLQNGPVVLDDVGLHRLAVRRGLLDGGHVPQAREGHVQRPGNGRRGEGQHVHLAAELLEALLVGHAEALLLVDDEEPQVLKGHALLQQLVGADQKVHAPGADLPENPLCLPGGRKPGEDLDGHREVLEPAQGGGVVLLGQHGGGHQNGGLLAVQDALHHRPQGHLRLAVAHVAAEEPVHGPGLLHVPFDLLHGPQLVIGLGVGERLLKLPLPHGVRGEGEARAALPLGVELGETLGQVLYCFFRPGLLLGPLGAPQLVQPRALLVLPAADVLGHHVQLGGRHVQAVSPGVVDLDIVLLHAVHGHPLDAGEPAHAVVDVDHQVPGGQVRVGLEPLAVGGLLHLHPPLGGGGELTLRQHRQAQLGPLAAGGQGSDADAHLPGPGHGGVFQVQHGGDVPLLQQALEILRPALPGAEHQHRAAVFPVVGQVAHGGLQASAVGAELPDVHAQKPLGPQGIAGGGQGVCHHHREILQGGVQLLGGEGQPGVLPRHDPRLQQRFHVLLGLEQGPLDPLVHPAALAEEHHAVPGQIVDPRRRLGIDGRQIPVHAAGVRAVFQALPVLPEALGGPLRPGLFP